MYVSEKDNEIEILTRRIAERAADTGYPAPRDRTGSRVSSPDSTASDRSPGPVPVTTTGSRGSGVRKRKAPPVDSFHGDSRSIKLDEWLPTLERAATWNAWSEQDKLLQLAGHLRGRALQEWSLLQGSEKQTMDSAVEALRNRLDPGSRMLGALEFKHMSQHPKEGVCEFVTRLEKAFREAYGREPLSKETRDALLFAQLQDGLRYELVQAPAVSGALSYEQLCIAAKGEERRLVALRKRQELGGGRSQDGLVPPRIRPKSMRTSQTEGRHPRNVRDRSGKRVCYVCQKPGHFGNECRKRKTESSGERLQNRGTSFKSTSQHKGSYTRNPGAKQVQSESVEHDSESGFDDPRRYLVSSEEDSDSSVQSVRVKDTGSRAQYANVDLQGVPAKGVIDSGADITIIGGDLFKKVAMVAKLRKKDFRKADKTPRTYDQRSFVLHGCIDLDITFGGKTMSYSHRWICLLPCFCPKGFVDSWEY